MIAELALAATVAVQDRPIPGADKVKHFFMSAFVHSVSFAVARAVGADRSNAQLVAGISSMSVGLLKEVRDARVGTGFSVPDLVFDAAGALAAAALLNGTR